MDTLTNVARAQVAPAGVSHAEFRAGLRLWAAAVTVITGERPGEPGRPIGFTATSFTSASLSPPLVSFYVGMHSRSWTVLRRAGFFGVSVLAAHQAGIASQFASKTAERFLGVQWRAGPYGVPLLCGAALHLACQCQAAMAVGDHILVVGLVVHSRPGLDGDAAAAPLLYANGDYRQLR